MKKILAAVTAPDIIHIIDEACKKYASYFDFDICSDTDEIIKYINYELPEIKVIDFTSTRIDSRQILESISADPWLHNGGIIAVVADMEERKEIEEQKNANILIVQTKRQFADNFSRLLHILWLNQQFLFSRGMQGQLGTSESGSFICGNDPIDIQVYTSFLLNYLYSSNRIDTDIRSKLHTVLMELLFNALEHGNCGISYEEKTEWLEKGNDILVLIKQKAQLDENKKKHIYISYEISGAKAEIFDPRRRTGLRLAQPHQKGHNPGHARHGHTHIRKSRKRHDLQRKRKRSAFFCKLSRERRCEYGTAYYVAVSSRRLRRQRNGMPSKRAHKQFVFYRVGKIRSVFRPQTGVDSYAERSVHRRNVFFAQRPPQRDDFVGRARKTYKNSQRSVFKPFAQKPALRHIFIQTFGAAPLRANAKNNGFK